jgi:hypothetical protein
MSTFLTLPQSTVFVSYSELGKRDLGALTHTLNNGRSNHSMSANKNVEMLCVRLLSPHITDFVK